MTSGKPPWPFLEAISCVFLFVLFPLVPATRLSVGYSNSYMDSCQPPVPSLLGHLGELSQCQSPHVAPAENLQWLTLCV